MTNHRFAVPANLDLEQRKVFYTEANTRVAVLCNHQRAKAANHDEKMGQANEKLEIDKQALDHLKKALPKAKKSKDSVDVRSISVLPCLYWMF